MTTFAEIDIEFDFEESVRRSLPSLAEVPQPTTSSFGLGSFGKADPKLRTVVCRHWLQGLCQKGDKCDYLHKMDKSKMPVCKHGKICKIKNCPLKHIDEEEKPECIAFRQGFCIDGPACKYRHTKRPPDECPKKANFDQFISASTNQNGFLGKKRKTQQPNQFYKITLCKHWLEHGTCPYSEECHYAHGEEELRPFPGTEDLDDTEIIDHTKNIMSSPLVLPFSSNHANVSYFLCHSPDLRSLTISKRRCVWAVNTRLMNELNTAYRTSENVVLFFICRSQKGIYGMARMTGPIAPHPPTVTDKQPILTPEFAVTWMKVLRISIKLIAQLKMSAGFGTSVGRTLTDGRIDKSAGYEILLIALRKPEWDWAKVPKLVASSASVTTGINQSPPPPLPPDVLFAPDWGLSRDVPMVPPGSGVVKATQILQQKDFYGGDVPGFLLPCPAHMLNEIALSGLLPISPEFQELVSRQMKPGAPVFLCVSSSPGSMPTMQPTEPLVYGLFESRSGLERDPRSNMPQAHIVRIAVVLEAPPLRGRDVEMSTTYAPPLHLPPLGRLSLPGTKQLSNAMASRVGALPAPVVTQVEPSASKSRLSAGSAGTSTNMHSGPGQTGPSGIGSFRSRFKLTENVLVDIPFVGDGFQLRRKLLGSQAALIMQIVNTVATQQTLQIRLRGIGSGFKEGQMQIEFNEPLHFVVSSDDENTLKSAVVKVQEHVTKVKLNVLFDV